MINKKYIEEGYSPQDGEKFIYVQLLFNVDDYCTEKDILTYIATQKFNTSTYKEIYNDTYINIHFYSKDIKKLWKEMKLVLLNSTEIGEWIKKVSTIACEGDNGWDDYLLLWGQGYDKDGLDEIR